MPVVLRSVCTHSVALCAALFLSACTLIELPAFATDGDSTSTDAMTSTAAGDTTQTSGAAPTEGGPVDPSGGTPGECDFPGAVQPIFTASCGCHAGTQPAQGLSLAAGEAHAMLVDVASSQSPGVPRVSPGDPASSYLLEKLAPGPSVGAQMPIGGMLPPEQVATISAWIAAGAPESAPFACTTDGASGDVGEVDIDVPGPVVVQVGETVTVSAVVTDSEGAPIDATVTWTSSAELTLYADGQGVLLGVSPGTAELTASAGGVTSAPIAVEVVAHVPAAATFSQVLALTDQRCAVAGCHVDGVEPGDLRFDRDAEDIWEELVEDGAEQVNLPRVDAGAPTNSYLLRKLVQRAPAVGGQMPLGAGPLAAGEVQVILRWILAGAALD